MHRFQFRVPKTLRLSVSAICFGASLLVHIVCLYAFGLFGTFDFAAPVMMSSVIKVDLTEPSRQQETVADSKNVDEEFSTEADFQQHNAEQSPVVDAESDSMSVPEAHNIPLPDNRSPHVEIEAPPFATEVSTETKTFHQTRKFELLQPLRTADEFVATESEKLTYRIYLLGIPMGSAELEARRDKNDVWITLRITTDTVISSFYPVDNLIETRHINGNFIVSRIRQKEGSFIGDRGFTLFLRDKNVFWIDRLTRKSVYESIPSSEVVDILSGLYYLRNRPLQVGVTETLHIYDSNSYSAVPVDVLRRETVLLSGLRAVESLLVQPQLKTEGFFRRTGEIQIWLSDDEFRVPVKVVTDIALGRVTAELVSAELKLPEQAGLENILTAETNLK